MINLDYTDGNKNECVPKFISDEPSLCQRQWRWCEEIGDYLSPIKLPSLYKSLHWQNTSDLDPMTAFLQNLESAMKEFARHEPDVFKFHQSTIRRVLEENDVYHLASHFIDISQEEHIKQFKLRHFDKEQFDDESDSEDDGLILGLDTPSDD
jgi:hypothetical protein